MQLRQYQTKKIQEALPILKCNKLVYLAMETRTGKTITSLALAQIYGAQNILFVTKKKVLRSVLNDAMYFPGISVTIVNHESIEQSFKSKPFTLCEDFLICDEDGLKKKNKKLITQTPRKYDMVIIDEAHVYKGYPKPSMRTRKTKALLQNLPIIFLSATPTPESFSEIYHTLWISSYSPFREKNFYAWARTYVQVQNHPYLKVIVNNREMPVRDYSGAIQERVAPIFNKIKVTCTQIEAGFIAVVNEEFLTVPMEKGTRSLYNQIKNPKGGVGFVEGEMLMVDNASKKLMKLHQIASGTVIVDSGKSIVFDKSKAVYIKNHVAKNGYTKFAIYYKFKGELELIKDIFSDKLIFTPQEFQAAEEGIFVSQIQAGREGIRLSEGQALYFLNIDFAYLSYEQTRNRMQDMTRKENSIIYWVFSDIGLEQQIYDTVKDKEDFTLSHFRG